MKENTTSSLHLQTSIQYPNLSDVYRTNCFASTILGVTLHSITFVDNARCNPVQNLRSLCQTHHDFRTCYSVRTSKHISTLAIFSNNLQNTQGALDCTNHSTTVDVTYVLLPPLLYDLNTCM